MPEQHRKASLNCVLLYPTPSLFVVQLPRFHDPNLSSETWSPYQPKVAPSHGFCEPPLASWNMSAWVHTCPPLLVHLPMAACMPDFASRGPAQTSLSGVEMVLSCLGHLAPCPCTALPRQHENGRNPL